MNHKDVKWVKSSFLCYFIECDDCDSSCEKRDIPKLFDDRDLLKINNCIDILLNLGHMDVFIMKMKLMDRIKKKLRKKQENDKK